MQAPRATETHSPDKGTRDRWLVLSLVALNYFVLYLHRNLLNYVQAPLCADLNLDDTQLGILRQAFLLPYCLAQIAVGYLSDRFSRRRVILGSLVASSLALAILGCATGFRTMLAGRLLLAFGQSAAVPAMASLLVDCFSARSRSTAIGVYLASYNCALIVAGKFGGRVADTATWRVAPFGADGWYLDVAGWRMAHFLFAALGGSAAIVLYFGLREPRRTKPAGKADSILPLGGALLSVVRIPSWWVIALVFTLTGITINTVQFWLPRYLHDHFHLKLEDAGLLATLWIQSATIIGLLAGGKIGDRMATWGIAGRTALQSLGLAALIPALFTIGTSDRRMALIAAMVVYGFGVGMYQANLWAATFEVVRPATRATSVGLLNLTSGTLGFWSDPVIGAVHETVGGLGHVIAALGVPIAASVLLLGVNMLWLLRRDHLRSPMG